ncbi:MAG: Uma2 family endonuclease [Deltaproteobacteria bacterium]|nr:Uma2 family endonuclease [Kofleriaceae bacterium]
MSGGAAKGQPKTIADWLALPDGHRIELIDGEFVEKAAPTYDHGNSQAGTVGALRGPFARRPGGPGGPGGWWIATEVDVVLDGRVFRPDIAGWRRERAPEPPRERPVALRPDWFCEIVSDSNRTTNTVIKLRRYHQAGVPHYWILDQVERTLTVHRHTTDGYLVRLRAEAAERVRAEPFDAIELHVAVLLGDDEA